MLPESYKEENVSGMENERKILEMNVGRSRKTESIKLLDSVCEKRRIVLCHVLK